MDLSPYEIAQKIIFGDIFDQNSHIQVRRRRLIRDRVPLFEVLDETDFSRRFRLSKDAAVGVLEFVRPELEFHTNKNDAVQPMNQLLLALRFYATGCTQLAAADFAGVSEATAHRIVHRVSSAIARVYPDHIYMPRNEAEILHTQRQFAKIARLPKVIGAVDGTHIKIRSPGGDHAEYYRNRKGFFSLNVQAICNADLEFTDVVARWPGSTHDQTIFYHSRVRAQMESDSFGDAMLLGDSAYASRSYMMTPLDNPTSPADEVYNESQIRTWNPVERSLGALKRRFPALAIGLNVRLEKVQAIIYASAVLHNMLRRANDPLPPDDPTMPLPWDQLLSRDNVEASIAGHG